MEINLNQMPSGAAEMSHMCGKLLKLKDEKTMFALEEVIKDISHPLLKDMVYCTVNLSKESLDFVIDHKKAELARALEKSNISSNEYEIAAVVLFFSKFAHEKYPIEVFDKTCLILRSGVKQSGIDIQSDISKQVDGLFDE